MIVSFSISKYYVTKCLSHKHCLLLFYLVSFSVCFFQKRNSVFTSTQKSGSSLHENLIITDFCLHIAGISYCIFIKLLKILPLNHNRIFDFNALLLSSMGYGWIHVCLGCALKISLTTIKTVVEKLYVKSLTCTPHSPSSSPLFKKMFEIHSLFLTYSLLSNDVLMYYMYSVNDVQITSLTNFRSKIASVVITMLLKKGAASSILGLLLQSSMFISCLYSKHEDLID